VITILAFIVVLGILVFVHELGHFVVAKLAGIRVLRFSFGFGKVLFAVRWRGTEYAISLLPLGGYVKMAGGDEREREGKPDEFLSKPPWVRMLVAFAGPALNFVLAVLLFAAVAKMGYTLYTFPNRVGGVLDTVEVGGRDIPAPARAAGFQPGDVVLAVDGEATPYWFDLQRVVKTHARRALRFEVRRGAEVLTLEAQPALDAETGRGFVGLLPYQAPEVYAVAEDSRAGASGLTQGDRLLALDGRAVTSFNELLDRVEGLPVGRHLVAFETGRGRVNVAVEYDGGGVEEFVEELGVVCGLVAVERSEGWLGALPAGAARTWEIAGGTVRGLALVVRGQVKVTKALGGPLTIARFAGETARAGFLPYVEYLAFLSVMLGMLNLLPVPVLDGGHIIIGVFETVRRKNLSARVREVVNLVGFAFMVLLVALALFADVTRVFSKSG
jgi:regulator of sigma E protease